MYESDLDSDHAMSMSKQFEISCSNSKAYSELHIVRKLKSGLFLHIKGIHTMWNIVINIILRVFLVHRQ